MMFCTAQIGAEAHVERWTEGGMPHASILQGVPAAGPAAVASECEHAPSSNPLPFLPPMCSQGRDAQSERFLRALTARVLLCQPWRQG